MARWLILMAALALGGCVGCTDSPYSASMMMVPQPGQCAYCDYPGVHEEAACPAQVMAQDHPTDDYFRMGEDADRQAIEADRYREQRDELLREREQDMNRRDDERRRNGEPPATRSFCLVAGVIRQCDR